LDGAQSSISSATPLCNGICDNQNIASIKGELDKAALQLAAQTLEAADILASAARKKLASRGVSKDVAERIITSAARAKVKANQLVAAVKRTLLEVPDVTVTCPFTKPYCKVVDREGSINALRGLYTEMYKDALARFVNRYNFILSGVTTRTDRLLAQGRTTRASGETNLQKVPRFSTACG
jgi:hypothetical protein